MKTFVIIQQAAISRLENMKLYEKFDTETIDACIQVIKKTPAVSKEYMDMTDLKGASIHYIGHKCAILKKGVPHSDTPLRVD